MLLVNKPKNITSHDVVDEIRKITHERRVGHAGTLDPFAEGLLIVLVGREETKQQAKFLKMDKVYEATFILGEERDTDDVTGNARAYRDGAPIPPKARSGPLGQVLRLLRGMDAPSCGREDVENVLRSFEGEIEQVPPIFSAVKLKGKKAYELARKGIKPELKPKKVKIYYIKILDYNYPKLRIETKVSSGTYIRALARDVGRKLGTGAYVKELKRTEIGKYKLKEAKTLEELNK